MSIEVHLSNNSHRITKLDTSSPTKEGKVIVRGFPLLGESANALVNKSYEEAMFTLWHGIQPSEVQLTQFRQEIGKGMADPNTVTLDILESDIVKKPLLAIQMLVLSLGYSGDISEAEMIGQSFFFTTNLIRRHFGKDLKFPDGTLGPVESIFEMLDKDDADPELMEAFSKMMVAWIDIGAGPGSTVVARINASSRTNIVTSLAAGVGNQTGSRHTSARNEALKMMTGILDSTQDLESDEVLRSTAKNEVQSRIDRGEVIPGFGHWVFKGLGDDGIDPRIYVVQEAIEKFYADSPYFKILKSLREVFASGELKRNGDEFRLPPNSDIYWAVFVREFLSDLSQTSPEVDPSDVTSLFSILARIPGLVAQRKEQLEDGIVAVAKGDWITG